MKCYNPGQPFRYHYDNSSNPCIPTGLPNQIGGPYIYYATPIPPSRTKNKWYMLRRRINLML